MATAIQRRRGTSAQHANFTGLAGEITIDTTLNTIIVHDGVTQGGVRLAKYSEVVSASEGDITAVNTVAGGGLTGGTTSGAANLAIDYENLSGNLVPSVDNTYSLGTADKVWKDVFVGPGSLYVNGQKVLEDNSGTITLTADAGQSLALLTSGGGDVELNAGTTGDIQLKSNVVLSAGKTITASGGLTLASNINADSNSINNLADPVADQDAATKAYVDNDSTVVRVTGAQTIAGAKTFSDNMVINGTLTVAGTTTTVNSETISLADNIIDLNSNFTSGAPTENAGIRIQRGDETAAQLRWNEANDYWETVDGSGATKIALDTDDLAEGSTNVYYTDARAQGAISVTDAGGDGSLTYAGGVITYTGPSASEVRAHFSDGTGINYNSSTGVISADDSVMATKAYVDSQVQSKDALSELSGDTDDVSEGSTNLYYTDARARSAISVSGDLDYNSSTGIFSITLPASDNYQSWTISDGSNSEAIGSGAQLKVVGSGATSTSYDAATNTLTVSSTDNNTVYTHPGSHPASFITTVDEFANSNSTNVQDVLDDLDAAISGKQASGSYVTTSSAQALSSATNAMTISGHTITLARGDGTTDTVTVPDNNSVDYINSASFDVNTGVLTLSGVGNAGATVDLDGRFTDNAYADTMNQHVRTTDDVTFGIITGTATAARYADLAEKYATDAELEAGTVVVFGGDAEVTACSSDAHHAVAGVISTDPAYMMNSEAEGQYVALTGRVPVKVTGPVAKGDLMVTSSVAGHAKADNNAQAGRILGKAISAHEGEGEGVVEVLITLM